MQIVDITSPAAAKTVATYDCGVTQGDVQIFRQADKPGRTFAGYASDTFGDGTSTCYREAAALGFDVLKEDGTGKNGTFIVELTNPLAPKTVSFVGVEQGTHNHSIHPSGKYLYNSNSDLITSVQPAIEIYDISNFAAPRKVRELALPTRPGLGTESHDITFNTKGDRAYSAALSQGVIINTADPARPTIVSSFLDPSINVWHQMDPFTMTDSQGNQREFLIAEDEVAGAVGTGQCPNGGVHVYEITDSMETNPQKVGYWNIDDVRADRQPRQLVHGARVRHPRARAADDDRLLQRRRPRGRHLRPDGDLARRLDDGRRPRHARDRLLPGRQRRRPRLRRHVVVQGAEGQPHGRLLRLRQRHRARPGRLPLQQLRRAARPAPASG